MSRYILSLMNLGCDPLGPWQTQAGSHKLTFLRLNLGLDPERMDWEIDLDKKLTRYQTK